MSQAESDAMGNMHPILPYMDHAHIAFHPEPDSLRFHGRAFMKKGLQPMQEYRRTPDDYRYEIWRDTDAGVWVGKGWCWDDMVYSQGETCEEALAAIRSAVRMRLEVMADDGATKNR